MTEHILLTTIGAGKLYDETTYTLGGETSDQTRFFSDALLRFLHNSQRVTRVVVLLTEGASKGVNWEGSEGNNGLQGVLEEYKRELNHDLEVVSTSDEPIPNGLSEDEIWAIFDRISGLVGEGSRLTLDLTHGFRSLPLIMLLTVAYLRSAKNITINAVYYGAYDATSRSSRQTPSVILDDTPKPPAPALDLAPFLTLFEWVTAVDAFERTGNLRQIADLMRDRQDSLFKNLQDKSKLPTRFKSVASTMQKLSEALMLGRLKDIAEVCEQLGTQLGEQEATARQWLVPLTAQIIRIQEDFKALVPKSERPNDLLLAQFNLVKWYIDHEHFMQAGLLLREWFVTWYANQDKGGIDWTKLTTDKEERGKVEQRLSSLIQVLLVENTSSNLSLKLNLSYGGIAIDIVETWNMLTNLRNDLGHVGHRADQLDVNRIREQLKKLVEQLQPLANG